MPLMNLVQERQLAIRRAERKARVLFFAFGGVTVCTIFGFGFSTLQTANIEREQANVRLKLRRLAPLLKQIESNDLDVQALTPRLQTLREAQEISDKWDRILRHLVVETPQGTWLTALHGQSNDPKKPISIAIIGKGTEQRIIGDLMLRAQAEPDLENVTLKFTEEKDSVDSQTIDFEVDADLKGTMPPSTKKGGKV